MNKSEQRYGMLHMFKTNTLMHGTALVYLIQAYEQELRLERVALLPVFSKISIRVVSWAFNQFPPRSDYGAYVKRGFAGSAKASLTLTNNENDYMIQISSLMKMGI
jgi:hypothetical protein